MYPSTCEDSPPGESTYTRTKYQLGQRPSPPLQGELGVRFHHQLSTEAKYPIGLLLGA